MLDRKILSKIATWNVRTLYQTGKLTQVVREMGRLHLDILGASEMRWNGTGEIMPNGETILSSSNPDKYDPHEKGIGLGGYPEAY